MYRKFRFKKEFSCPDGTIHEGSEITIIGDRLYFDGGLVNPAYYSILIDIINTPEIAKEYLKEYFANPEARTNNF